MEQLSRARKTEIFRMGVDYGLRSRKEAKELHEIVGEDRQQHFEWRTDPGLPDVVGLVGEFHIPGQERPGILVVTAPVETSHATVAFTYAHEIGHLLLGHKEQGSFLFGFYTKREAEADAFAYSFLYATVQWRAPGGGSLAYHAVYRAMQRVHADDRGFAWRTDTRHADINTIQAIITEMGGRELR